MKKLTFTLTLLIAVAILASPAFAWGWWGPRRDILPRHEYTHAGMFAKLELTEEQAKLVKAHRQAVNMEFEKGLFSILTRAQIKKRKRLIAKFEAEWKEKWEEIQKKLEKIEDEAEREAKYSELAEHSEWLHFLRKHFFNEMVEPLRIKIRQLLRDNDGDPDPCIRKLNSLRKRIDKVKTKFFKWAVRCRLGLSFLQYKMLHERDKIRHENWDDGLKEILTKEQFEYLLELRKERDEFYKAQHDKFEKKLEGIFKDKGEDWNPFSGKSGKMPKGEDGKDKKDRKKGRKGR